MPFFLSAVGLLSEMEWLLMENIGDFDELVVGKNGCRWDPWTTMWGQEVEDGTSLEGIKAYLLITCSIGGR